MRKTTIIKQCRIDWETCGRQGRREEPAQHTVWYVSRHRSAGRWIARWITVDTILFSVLTMALTGCTVQHPAPNLAGQDVHLTVVHTADLHSRFFPYYFAP